MSTYPATADLPEQASVVSRWLLDEASGNRADSVGSNTLTDNNTVTAGTGYSDAGANFDNAADFERDDSEYFSIADGSQSGLDITGDLSISLWANIESKSSQNMSFVNKWDNDQQSLRGFAFSYLDGTGLAFLNNNGVSNAQADATFDPTLSQWYHIVVVYDASAGSARFYSDGSPIATDTGLHTSIQDVSSPFQIGALKDDTAQTDTLDGLMQDAIIWNTTLTDQDISDLYDLYTTASGIKGSPIFFT